MKVTILGYGMSGGMHHYSVQLANAVSHYVNASLVLPEGGDATKFVSDDVNIREYEIPDYSNKIEKPVSAIKMYREIYRLIKNSKPDLIHHSFIGPTTPTICLPIMKLDRVPIISTLHDPIKVVGNNISTAQQRKWIIKIKLAVSISDKIIVHGKSTWNQSEQAGYTMNKFKSIPHGKYDIFKFYDYKEKPQVDNTVLFFGSIRPEKGFDRIIDILDYVERDVPNIKAIVAGNPSDERSNTVKQLSRDDRVDLHADYIPNQRVGELFSQASLVVLPYYRATSSGVLMTAYAFQKPVVATKVGDIEHLVSRDGVGLLCDDVSDMGDAIVELLTNHESYTNIVENMELKSPKYSWKRIGEETIKQYMKLLQ